MKKTKERGGEEGIALVITLLVMTILLMMASAFMSISSTETLIAINERNRVQAYHLAEAGAEFAIARLNVDPGYAGTGGGEVALPPDPAALVGKYKVTVTCVPPAAPAPPCPPATPDQRIITATGCVRDCTAPGRAVSTVEMRVQRGTGSPFQFSMLGAGSGVADYRAVQLEIGVQVDSYDSALGPYGGSNLGGVAHVHSNGNFELGSDNVVKGNVQTVGIIQEVGSPNFIEGSTTTGVPSQSVNTSIPFPPFSGSTAGMSPSSYYDTATHELNVPNGMTVSLAPGTYSFDKITMGTDSKLEITGPVVIFMSGRFSAGRGAKINASDASTKKPTDLMIFSSNAGTDDAGGEEAFFFCCNDDSVGGEFYGGIHAPNGEVEFQNALDSSQGWKIYGAIVAKKIDIEDHARLHYDLALSRSATPISKFRPMAGTWQERLPSN